MTLKEFQNLAKERRSEHEEQKEVVRYLTDNKILHTSMPNENKYTGIIAGLLTPFFGSAKAQNTARKISTFIERKMKAEGKQKGYPDLIIDVPNRHYHGLRIEMKRRPKTLKSGKKSYAGIKVSEHQQAWLQELNQRNYKAIVCYGSDEAIDAIEEYMEDM